MSLVMGQADRGRANRLGDTERAARPSDAQLRYLRHGLDQPGGKLPLFDHDGQEIPARTIRACIDKGWATPWFDNPTKRNWLVCRLTDDGRAVAGKE